MIDENIIREQFEKYGFVIVEGVFDPARDFKPILDDYAEALDLLAVEWHREGKISSLFADLPFEQRFTAVVSEARQPWTQYFDISLPQKDVLIDTPIHCSEAVFNLLRHPRLLDAVEIFLGAEIYSNPIQHVRIKAPERLLLPELRRGLAAQTSWHQDQGVALPEADHTDILTVWLPILDATAENGCLQVIPGSYRGDLTTHCLGGVDGGLHIPDKLLNGQPIPLPMKCGSVLFMHRLTKHSSLPNASNSIRWSLDLRYQPTGLPTGRPLFPGFVARSRQNPASALTDHRVWAARWHEVRAKLAQESSLIFNRWDGTSPVCA